MDIPFLNMFNCVVCSKRCYGAGELCSSNCCDIKYLNKQKQELEYNKLMEMMKE